MSKTLFHFAMAIVWIMLFGVHGALLIFASTDWYQRIECCLCFWMAVLCTVDAFMYMKG